MTTVYVVSECFREPWQDRVDPPSRARILAVYSNETAARTHAAGIPYPYAKGPLDGSRWLRIEAFEVDSLCTESAP